MDLSPSQTTAYDRERLERAYGSCLFDTERIAVDPDRFETLVEHQRADALGGARVLVHRADESEALLVSNRGEHGWDVPGGSREADETPEETAVRECHEETNLAVGLRDLRQVLRFTFVCDASGATVSGLWVHFEGVPRDPDQTRLRDDDELDDVVWMHRLPDELDPYVEPVLRNFFA